MRLLFILLTFIISRHVHATHTLTYYIYVETEYTQGPWTRANLLDASQYRYLAAQVHEDLLGSEPTDLVNKLLSRLKENKPEIYNWSYELTIEGDSVFITPKETVKNMETVKNEITATLLFNNFKAVSINMNGRSQLLTINDLTLPYFDLVSKQVQPVISTDTLTVKEPVKNETANGTTENGNNLLIIGLIASIILNMVLAGLLLRKKAR